MDAKTDQAARDWYSRHRTHVNKLLGSGGPMIEPTDRDPALWKDIHWRWFMVRVVAGQIFKAS